MVQKGGVVWLVTGGGQENDEEAGVTGHASAKGQEL